MLSGLSASQGNAPTTLPLQPSSDFEFEQDRADNGSPDTGQLNQIVDRDRRRPEHRQDALRGSVAVGAIGKSRGTRLVR